MTSRPNGLLYVGVTDNLPRHAWEHRDGLVDGFTKRYGLKRLVYFEPNEDVRDARQCEQNLKHYPRAWKVRLILLNNPNWDDLSNQLVSSAHRRAQSDRPNCRSTPCAIRVSGNSTAK